MTGWSNQTNRRLVVVEGSEYTGLFFYEPTAATGNLVGSWTTQAGTDPYENAYPPGLEVGNGTGQLVGLGVFNGTPTLYWAAGTANVQQMFSAFADTVGSGTNQYGQLIINGQADLTQKDFVSLVMNASSESGTQNAVIALEYTDPSGTVHAYAFQSFTGFTVAAGSITAVEPGTGLSRSNPAVAETWHDATPLLAANWTTSGASNPLRYRLEPQGSGGGCVRLDGEILTAGSGPWTANTTIFMLPTGYHPAKGQPFVTRSDQAVAAGQDTVNVLTTGSVQNGQAFTAAGQRLFFDGVTFPLD